MGKEKIPSQEGNDEGEAIYTANLEDIIFVGIINFPWQGKRGEKRDVLRINGFDFGILGNEILCDREKFPEMAQKIAEVKKALYKGNRQPMFEFIQDTFFVAKNTEKE